MQFQIRAMIILCWFCNFLFRVTIRLCWLCSFRLLVRSDCAGYAISDYGYDQIMLQKLQPCANNLTIPAKKKKKTAPLQCNSDQLWSVNVTSYFNFQERMKSTHHKWWSWRGSFGNNDFWLLSGRYIPGIETGIRQVYSIYLVLVLGKFWNSKMDSKNYE